MNPSIRLIQLLGPAGRRVGIVDERSIRLLRETESIYALASRALAARVGFAHFIRQSVSDELLDYDPIYDGASSWRILPSIDHPQEPARCVVSGTGLTHRKSASSRQAMHAAGAELTDSIRMYQWGLEGGKPASGAIGVAPEWFYKGTGGALRAHNQPLDVPPFAEDGGEEAEIAGVYLIDHAGVPRRIGMTAANEFSDHVTERKNYLYLAPSKLRSCAIGPELVVDPDFTSVPGQVAIRRRDETIWHKRIQTGESVMCHSLANIEHHHFKFDAHRRPGDIHVHFFGADAFSFADGIRLEDGDLIEIQFEGFGRALRNPVRIAGGPAQPVRVLPI
ncbi:MAG TPA: AraD1 family protein [Bryobacteraceae bacterium]|jgi:hypothetical protein|nr:AraD1 family protein [Bryobacteraceae bacterium]